MTGRGQADLPGDGAHPSRAARDGRGTILVVDDDADFRELLVEHLLARGHQVRAARDGADALAALTGQDAIHLVLLDLRMPGVDGFEVCRVTAATPALATIPIVVVTAEHETREVASSPCVVAVLHKPLDLVRLEALTTAYVR